VPTAADALAWTPVLHDPRPVDLAISGLYLAVLALLGWSTVRPGLNWRQRLRWAGVGGVVAALLVNQQGDLHVFVIDAAAAEFRAVGLSMADPLIADAARVAFAGATAIGAVVLLLLGSRGRAPGRWGSLGLLLLLVHASGRAVTFAHLVDGPWAQRELHPVLLVVEVAGLLLLAIGALRWGRGRARAASAPLAGPVAVPVR
jgi:hypothetical protein